MANILNPTVVSIVKGTAFPIVRSLSYGGGLGNEINVAYEQANTALALAQDAYNYANTISGGSAIDNVARQAASTADTKAQAAYNKANSATTIAYSSYNQANSASALASDADILAQAAFNKANTTAAAGVAGSTYQVQYNRSGSFAANSHFIYDFNQSTLHVDKIDTVIDAGSF
jgi:hypothetical protein